MKKPDCECWKRDPDHHNRIVGDAVMCVAMSFLDHTINRGLCPPATLYALNAVMCGILRGMVVAENGEVELDAVATRIEIARMLDEMKTGVLEHVDMTMENDGCLH